MIELIPVEYLADIQEQREYYMNELVYSQELNTVEHTLESQFYKIKMNSVWIGYFCVDSEKTLWEFYLIKGSINYSQEVFRFLIDMNYIVAAECISYDHLLMSLCFDFHKKALCSAYVFRDYTDVNYLLSAFDNISVRLATKEDFNSLSEISNIGEGMDDFFYNLEEEILKKEIFIFCSDKELLGAGTCKKIWHNKNYYDIGMVVANKYRKKGIGTYIIIKLKEYCFNNKQIPVCGCWYPNYQSKKTLEKAGFITKHRVIRFKF